MTPSGMRHDTFKTMFYPSTMQLIQHMILQVVPSYGSIQPRLHGNYSVKRTPLIKTNSWPMKLNSLIDKKLYPLLRMKYLFTSENRKVTADSIG